MSHHSKPQKSACKRAQLAIEKLEVWPSGPGIPLHTQFYPRDKIVTFLNREEVEKVLLCKCDSCKQHLSYLSQEGSNQSPRQYLDKIIPLRDAAERAVSLFALMILLQYPLLIIPLLSRGYQDKTHVDNYPKDTHNTRDREVGRLKEYFGCLGPDEAESLAKRFWETVFKFAVPTLSGKDFTIYHANTVLPFLTSERLGEGSFGDVFAFTIYADYNKLPVSFNTPRAPVYSP